MKIDVEIVTGFLGAGKTSFINSLLSESQVENEKVLVFQLESGEKEISKPKDFNYPVKLIKVKGVNDLKGEMIYSIKKYNPNRIIIEYNGTSSLEDLINILKERVYKECSKISTVFFIADGKTLTSYVENMKNFLVPFIQSSNMVVVNNIDNCSKEIIEEGLRKVKELNPTAYILKVNNKYILNSLLRESKVIDNGYIKKLKVKMKNSKK